MKNSILICDESQKVFDKKVDVNKINEDLVKEYQDALINNKILLNTSFSHDSYVEIKKTEYKKILSSLFSVILKSARENSRIIFQGYIEDNNYCLKITNNRNKAKNIQQLSEISEIKKILNNCRIFIRKQQGKLNIKISPENSLDIWCYIPVEKINKN